MCLVVDCSEKSVKSDYFGVIFYNWWRKVRKIGIFQIKMLILLKTYTKTPNTRDFRHKNSQLERFHAEYTENSGYSMRFLPKIGKFTLFGIKLAIDLTIWVENSEKSDFSLKTGTNFRTLFLQISTCGYVLAQLLQQLFFPHKQRWKYFTSHFCCKKNPSTIIVENTENSPNSSSYTIEYKLVRNSHLLSQKLASFLKCHSNCSTNKRKLLTHKIIKAAINCSYVYCEGIYGKVLQTCTILFKHTIVVTGVRKSTNISAQIQNK